MSIGLAAGALATYAGASTAVAGIASAVAPSLLSGVMGSDSAGDAYGSQAEGAGQANQTLQANYDQTRQDMQPYATTGVLANNKLAQGLGLVETFNNPQAEAEINRLAILNAGGRTPTAQDIAAAREQVRAGWGAQVDPNAAFLTKQFDTTDLANDVVYQNGLQFGLDEGAKGVNNMASATGKQLSGATLKALSRFGNDYATTKTAGASDRYTQRQNQQYGMLSGTSNSGQQAAGTVSQAGQAMAGGVAANQVGLGNARGASQIASGNSLASGLTGAYDAYQGNKLISSLTGTGSNRGSSYVGSEPYPGYNASVGL